MDNFFPSNLKHLRTQSGMTQTEIAKKLNKDYSTIGKWELGERNPTTLDLFKIADIFNVSERDIVNNDLSKDRNNIQLSQREILFNKTKNILSDSDWATIEFIMKKTIDEYEKNKNGG